VRSERYKLSKVIEGVDSPWSLSFIDRVKVLITEKSGNLLVANLKSKFINPIRHNLSIADQGQGGLLDILFKDKMVYVSYSEVRGGGKSSTSIAVGNFNEREIVFQNIFRANPPIVSGYHFGSRIVIKDNFLFASLGERGRGMIAQDPTKHPGSIIRINLNGKVPKDNPSFIDRDNWLPNTYLK
jgi:quinoprotein glucose dehydrogenase